MFFIRELKNAKKNLFLNTVSLEYYYIGPTYNFTLTPISNNIIIK